MKAQAIPEAANVAVLQNGTGVTIRSAKNNWYEVQAGSLVGYMHNSWVMVDQYMGGPFGQRYVQLRSFNNLAGAQQYVRSSAVPMAAYLASNGWFAVTLEDTFEPTTAQKIVEMLQKQGRVPEDAFVTYGNTYVRRVCCSPGG